SALDRIIEAGGYISVTPGAAPEANIIPVPKTVADAAFDAAACIGCGACVAACPNGAAQLFTAAKIAHLNLLPQGQAERFARTEARESAARSPAKAHRPSPLRTSISAPGHGVRSSLATWTCPVRGSTIGNTGRQAAVSAASPSLGRRSWSSTDQVTPGWPSAK